MCFATSSVYVTATVCCCGVLSNIDGLSLGVAVIVVTGAAQATVEAGVMHFTTGAACAHVTAGAGAAYVTAGADASYISAGGRVAYVTAGAPYVNGAGGCAYSTGWLPLASYTGASCSCTISCGGWKDAS